MSVIYIKKKLITKLLFLFGAICFVIIQLAFLPLRPSFALAAGDRDPSFQTGQLASGANNGINSSIELGDGKFLIAGSFTSYNGVTKNRIARLNSDGTLDTSFNTGAGADALISSLKVLSDGKILIIGDFLNYDSVGRIRIARLNADGSLDSSFNPGTSANAAIHQVIIQTDNKILLKGAFTSFNGVTNNYITRLNVNGDLDTTFTQGTGANAVIGDIELLSDGSIIIVGSFTQYNGVTVGGIAKLNSNGTQATFNSGTGIDYSISVMTMQSDGKILIGGSFSTYNGTGRSKIARLNADGSLDTSFNPGTGFDPTAVGYGSVSVIVMQPDGKILAGGNIYVYDGVHTGGIARINSNGSRDTSFVTGNGIYGVNGTSSGYSVKVQSDNKIVISGRFTTYNWVSFVGAVRLNVNGSADSSFRPQYLTEIGASLNVIEQGDGKIVLFGSFTSYDGTTRNRVARINSNGTLDPTFNQEIGPNSTIRVVKKQSDGKLIIAGDFTSLNLLSKNRIARINTDGTLDSSFDTGSGANDIINAVGFQSDGKIIIAGNFTSFNGTTRNRIARLNTDGSHDLTFDPGTGFNASVLTLVVQADDKIVLGGSFTSFNSLAKNRILRIDANGALDNIFSGTGTDGSVSIISEQVDGKLLIGGFFDRYNGWYSPCIVRISANGAYDSTFDMSLDFPYNGVYAIATQADGKIIIGGSFTTFDSLPQLRIARLTTLGDLDPTFDIGAGFNNTVRSIKIQTDNNIILGGDFTTYKGGTANRIVILKPDGSLEPSFNSTTAFNAGVYDLLPEAYQKIIVAGAFTSYNNNQDNFINRIYSNGDFINPLVSATQASSNWQIVQPLPQVSAEDEVGGSGLVEVRYSWGTNEMDGACSSGGTLTANEQTLADTPNGGTFLYLCSRDVVGNVGTWSGEYKWDGTAPSIPGKMLSTWVQDHYVNDDFLAAATDNSTDTGGSGLAFYSLWRSIDYTEVSPGCSESVASGLTSLTSLVEGISLPANGFARDYCWTASDVAGNTSDFSPAEYIRMDNMAPSANTTTASTTEGSNLNINANFTDSGGSLQTFQWFSDALCTNLIDGETTAAYLAPAHSSGNLNFSYKVSDAYYTSNCAVALASWTNVPPVISAVIKPADNIWTTDREFCATVTDSGSGDVMAKFVINGITFNGNTVVSGNNSCHTHSIDLASTSWYAYAVDDANTNSSETASFTAKLDATIPTGALSINSGNISTNDLNVSLAITGSDITSGVYQMQLSEDVGFSGASWEAFSNSKTWLISSGNGLKTVYLKLKDQAGNESTVYSDSIDYLELLPSPTPSETPTPSITETPTPSITETPTPTVTELPAMTQTATPTVTSGAASVTPTPSVAPNSIVTTINLSGFSGNKVLDLEHQIVGEAKQLVTGITGNSFVAVDSAINLNEGQSYTVYLKPKNYLSQKATNSVSGGVLTVPTLPGFSGGDYNNNDVINILDLGMLIAQYRQNNTNIDLTNDGYVNIMDLGAFVSNYRKSGDYLTEQSLSWIW